MRYIIASAVLGVMFIGSVVLNLFLAQHVVDASNAQWCSVLELITAKPVKPPADPKTHQAQQGQYIFYIKLRDLETHFKC